uniref:Retrovirus-related Pol polyprotein from transposon TNT 1-94-like beta-barrel domain-containing protein n=1 Tax=Cannabis sativa TaxID=3483 RepID=A0A803PBP7_CANSA
MFNSSTATLATSQTTTTTFNLVVFSLKFSAKLNNDNFLLWRPQILSTIKGHQLLNLILASFTPPCNRPPSLTFSSRGTWNLYVVNPHGNLSPDYSTPPPGVGAANIDRQSTNITTFDSVNDPTWYLDLGATSHCTTDVNNFTQKDPYFDSEQVHMGDGAGIPIQNVGKATFTTPYSSKTLLLN